MTHIALSLRTAVATVGLIGSAATAAGPGLAVGPTYGDTLLRTTMARHPDVSALRIEATGKAGAIVVDHGGLDPATARSVPLTDSMGVPIGTVRVRMRHPGHAAAIVREMGRRIYTPDGLGDPDPFVAGAIRAPRAQAIVERMVDSHPRLVTLAMHIAPPGGSNMILASNFGRIGKAADLDDQRVIAQGAVLREVTNGGRRLAVELPQKDAGGRVVGALSTSFAVTPGHDADSAYAEALALRDEIARATPSIEALTAP